MIFHGWLLGDWFIISMDWFKGKFPGKPNIQWEHLWCPVSIFPYTNPWIIVFSVEYWCFRSLFQFYFYSNMIPINYFNMIPMNYSNELFQYNCWAFPRPMPTSARFVMKFLALAGSSDGEVPCLKCLA